MALLHKHGIFICNPTSTSRYFRVHSNLSAQALAVTSETVHVHGNNLKADAWALEWSYTAEVPFLRTSIFFIPPPTEKTGGVAIESSLYEGVTVILSSLNGSLVTNKQGQEGCIHCA